MFAIVNGILGCFLIAWIGSSFLGLEARDIVLTMLGANLAAIVSGLLTLMAEATPSIKRHIRGGFRTWIVLMALFHGVLLAISPALRDPKTLAILWIPVILATGLAFPTVFGPIQDRIVRARQRRTRA